MTERRRAGEPEAPKRVAGAPAEAGSAPGTPTAAAPDSGQAAREADADERREEAEAARDAVEQDLDELLGETRRERDEYLELAQRTKADFENYRRRAARDAEEAERRGKGGLVRELVPVLDNLERALRAAGVDPEAGAAPADGGGDADGGGLAHGVLLVYRDLRATVERAGVESYDPAGQRFDPTWHEALSTRPDAEAEPGTVVEVVEKGYRLDGQVLRPARVIVSAEE